MPIAETDNRSLATLSRVEQTALQASPFGPLYAPTEKIPVIVVENFPALGRLVAMRFIEWVQANPDGVIALPTGKSPEHFIAWVRRMLAEWDSPFIRGELEAAGVDPARKPDMRRLHFVQIDEFYPINSTQTNSFNYYVRQFYLQGFGLDPGRAMLIDCAKIGLAPGERLTDYWRAGDGVDLTLRYRHAPTRLEEKQKALIERVDAWCMEYERDIVALGGIGFFLGGIGPDGHIGFNISGSDHYSTTRLCPVNYETQAAAATDLGGIEVARASLVITIGLRTITRNPDCTALIMAAGDAKAGVVRAAIESEPCVQVPASSLQALPRARFYITRGAGSALGERRLHSIRTAEAIPDREAHNILIELAVAQGKQLLALTEADCQTDPLAAAMLQRRGGSLGDLTRAAHESLIAKITRGMKTEVDKRFLHTEPHHDDVMLGYFANVVRHVRHAGNTHHFLTLTSGFTSVTNVFMLEQIRSLRRVLELPHFLRMAGEGYFRPSDAMGRNRDVWRYLDGVAARSDDVKAEGCARRLLRCLMEVFDEVRIENLRDRVDELEHYFTTQYPGKRDPAYIQRLKGMVREWEAECLWAYYGWNCENVLHLRLGFYTGEIFNEEPTLERDVPPIVEVLTRINPDIVTVALDPEASGPDTHYKVLQAMAEALRIHAQQTGRDDIRVWGYRNVWYRFSPAEADVFVPVSLSMLSTMQETFQNAFLSQKNASFPSYEYDGPFSGLAQRIQVEQYQRVKRCLGREWFYEHPSPLIRATRGMVFLRDMALQEFQESVRELRQSIENR